MKTTTRSRALSKLAAGSVGLGLAAVTVLGFSSAAFQAETDNAGNNWATRGFVTIDNDASAPLFSVGLNGAEVPITGEYDTELAPGESITDREIEIQFGGRATADIRMMVDPGFVATEGLDAETTLIVERDGAEIFRDTLANMPTTYDAAGSTAWVVGPDAAHATYNVSLQVSDQAVDGATLENVVFRWVAQQAAA